MSRHPVFESINDPLIKTYNEVNRFKINRMIRPSEAQVPRDTNTLEKVVGIHELAIVDYWPYAFNSDPANSTKRKIFHQTCSECFGLMEAFPMPENHVQKIVHVLKMLAYAYMGEKWEGMQRYLKEHRDVLTSTDNASWDHVLLADICEATILIARKTSYDDILQSRRIIENLRKRQESLEGTYLNDIPVGNKMRAAYQLASLYHLAKSVDLVGEYMLKGTPDDIDARLDFHFEKALSHSEHAGVIELDILLRLLHATFRKMTYNSIWVVAKRINSKVTEFVELVTRSEKPVFEFLYPQRSAILERGLLDPASRAIVVNMPTSGGKTMMAEFKILQAINTFGDEGKIVYVVPTRTLVNQIASRLRRDLGVEPLNIRIEKMSGAVEIDGFEDNLISKENSFDVLVTTPEKLNLLIRHPEKSLAKSLVLVIVDEAHNLGSDSRGLILEMLLSTIKKDCPRTHLLLLTPFIPNSHAIAEWLDPRNPKSISMDLDWKPNDRVVGLYHAQGSRRNIKTLFKPLVTSESTIVLNDEMLIGETDNFSEPAGKVKHNKYRLTSLVATQFDPSHSILVIAKTIDLAWKTAALIHENLPSEKVIDDKVRLVQKFIENELGADFPLIEYLDKRIGVHHSGLPEEIKNLMEWLMEEGSLRILVATTTIAQGVNFPVSGILMSSYAYPYRCMPHRDFWNLLGRAGRIDQPTLGVIGIAVDRDNPDDVSKTAKYVKEATEDLASVLVQMVEKAFDVATTLNLSILARDPEWSGFVQYVSHMVRQSEDIDQFIAESELVMRQTYGYDQLDPEKQGALLSAVRDYAEKLDRKQHLSTLSDMTGFTPETIEGVMSKIRNMDIKQDDWNTENLFSSASKRLNNLVGIMLTKIPEVKNLSEIKSKSTSSQTMIRDIISDWVSGKGIDEIAKSYFNVNDTDYKDSITACVNAIYGKIINSATWGLAGIQKIPGSGLKFETMSDEQRRRIANLPAMVYYGVDSEEAVLMRMQGVPRGISKQLGSAYRKQAPNQDIYTVGVNDVMTWLDKLPDDMWQPSSGKISGTECKRIWRRLSGKTEMLRIEPR